MYLSNVDLVLELSGCGSRCGEYGSTITIGVIVDDVNSLSKNTKKSNKAKYVHT